MKSISVETQRVFISEYIFTNIEDAKWKAELVFSKLVIHLPKNQLLISLLHVIII